MSLSVMPRIIKMEIAVLNRCRGDGNQTDAHQHGAERQQEGVSSVDRKVGAADHAATSSAATAA